MYRVQVSTYASYSISSLFNQHVPSPSVTLNAVGSRGCQMISQQQVCALVLIYEGGSCIDMMILLADFWVDDKLISNGMLVYFFSFLNFLSLH